MFNSFWLSNKRELQPSWFCIFSLNLKGFSVSGICWWSLFYQLCNCLLTQPSFFWQCQISAFFFFLFSVRALFHEHWQLTGQQGKGGDLFLLHSTTSTHSRTFRHLCTTLHVRWLSHIFNHNARIYQTATWWDLPPYQITIWLIDDVILILSSLACWFDIRFCYSYLTWKKLVDPNSHQLSPLYYNQSN